MAVCFAFSAANATSTFSKNTLQEFNKQRILFRQVYIIFNLQIITAFNNFKGVLFISEQNTIWVFIV